MHVIISTAKEKHYKDPHYWMRCTYASNSILDAASE